MHDIKSIRENLLLFAEGIKKRGLESESYAKKIEELDVLNRKYKTMLADVTYFRNRFNECCHKYPDTIDLSSLYGDKGSYNPIYNLMWCAETFLNPDNRGSWYTGGYFVPENRKYTELIPNYNARGGLELLLDHARFKISELHQSEFLTSGEWFPLTNLAIFLYRSLYSMMLLASAPELFPNIPFNDPNGPSVCFRKIHEGFIRNLRQLNEFDNLTQLLQEEASFWPTKNYNVPYQNELNNEIEKVICTYNEHLTPILQSAKMSISRYLSEKSSENLCRDTRFLEELHAYTRRVAKIVTELLDRKYEYAQEKQKACDEALHNLLASLPNIPDDSVPEGLDERDNQIIKMSGSPRKFDFTVKDHQELGEQLGIMSFAQAAAMSGSRFVVLKDDLARLERVLIDFMLGIAREHGYQEISPPLLVQDHAMYGAGQLPKFAEDSFLTTSGHRLIPTSEVSLVNLYANTVVEKHSLPIRLTAATPCFRSEAGSAGRDTRGMIRLHQFYKTELVSLLAEEESEAELERMTRIAESILENLQLPYRRVLLCAGDMGFSSAKTYDLEVWIPSQNKYREISSCSNCKSFQARRMNAKYKVKVAGSTKPERFFLHTLNGSALAVGRTLVAIMENYQNPDGSIKIPEVLQEKMGKALIDFDK